MSDAQKVNILYNSMLNKQKREKQKLEKRMNKFSPVKIQKKEEHDHTFLE